MFSRKFISQQQHPEMQLFDLRRCLFAEVTSQLGSRLAFSCPAVMMLSGNEAALLTKGVMSSLSKSLSSQWPQSLPGAGKRQASREVQHRSSCFPLRFPLNTDINVWYPAMISRVSVPGFLIAQIWGARAQESAWLRLPDLASYTSQSTDYGRIVGETHRRQTWCSF